MRGYPTPTYSSRGRASSGSWPDRGICGCA